MPYLVTWSRTAGTMSANWTGSGGGSGRQTVARAVGWSIPLNYPLVGRDAFRTATGVHAAAIIKAMKKGYDWLANRIYSGVPADYFGRRQVIELGPMSGQSNCIYWLEDRQIEPTPQLVEALFAACKQADKILSEQQALAVVASIAPTPR